MKVPQKIRILFFIGSLQIGGTERDLLTLVRNLDKNKFKVYIACLHKEGPFLEKISAVGVPIIEFCIFKHIGRKIRLRDISTLFSLKVFFHLVKFLRQEKIDVIHSLTGLTTIIGPIAGKVARTPRIISSMLNTGNWLERKVNEQSVINSEGQEIKLIQQLFSTVKVKAFRFVNRHIVNSVIVNAESIRQYLLDHRLADKQKVRVIYNCVDPSEFNVKIDVSAKKRELGLNPVLPVVGVVGTLRAVKGHRYFLEAAAKIANEGVACQFLIVGNGKAKNSLMVLSENLGLRDKVIFSGFRTDVAEVQQVIDIPVVSSTANEGLPNTLIEALSSGRPGVGTDIGGTSEIIRDGQTGFIVQPGNSNALAKAIRKLLLDDSLRKQMGRAAKELVAREFNLRRMLLKYEEIYEGQAS